MLMLRIESFPFLLTFLTDPNNNFITNLFDIKPFSYCFNRPDSFHKEERIHSLKPYLIKSFIELCDMNNLLDLIQFQFHFPERLYI